MLLINPLSENWTVEMLNARKVCKAHTDFIYSHLKLLYIYIYMFYILYFYIYIYIYNL